jgi:hypothetical protein
MARRATSACAVRRCVSCAAGRSRHGVLSEQVGAKARQQMAGGGVEELRGAKHRCQASGCACVPCTTLICQGMEAQTVMAHRQQPGSMPLALQKGLLSTRGWRTIHLASCLTGTWVPPECTPTTLLAQAASASAFFVPYSGERQVRPIEESKVTRGKAH